MGDAIKGFFLLILMIVGAAAVYLSWLVAIPVTEADAEFRIAHVCRLGQFAGRTLNGASHRPISCECVEGGLRAQTSLPVMAKGAEAMRQLVSAQIYGALSGERPKPPAMERLMADRDVVTFLMATQTLDRTCKVGAFAAR